MLDLIEGVELKDLQVIPDERGRLMEILRCDDKIFSGFGQVYFTTAYPGVVKAWHYHKKQDDFFCVIKGMAKIVLFDNRKNSKTKGKINEFFLGEHNTKLLKIPRLVYHGFKCISEKECIILNIPTKPYNHKNPDEYRENYNSKKIPYSWERKFY